MNQLNRRCFNCGTVIKECMGFVVARDIFPTVKPQVREFCGRCGILAAFSEEFLSRLLHRLDEPVILPTR